MTYGEAILFGALQGLTEYLPVSSSAHLILLPRFLETRDPGLAFDVFLHAGTLASTLVYYWRDWKELFAGLPGIGRWFERRAVGRGAEALPRNFWKWIVLGTVPALLAGALLHRLAEEQLRGNAVLASTLALGGILLWAADRFAGGKRPIQQLNWKTALGVGLAQCLALVPGMSRSGSTMMGGRLLGLDRAAAAKFSFLLSAPITAAALVFELRKWNEVVADLNGVGPLVAGALSAFLFGWFAIDGLLRVVRRFGYASFAVYRVALAAVIWAVLGV
jgi:undecaprenyl-diphosphatase